MGTVTKRYLDKTGLEYLVNKIKNEYHKVTHNSVSSGKYSVLLAGATSVISGKAYNANFSNDIKYDAADKKLTAPKIGATAIYQKTNQVVDTIKTKAPDGTVKTWTNSNGTVTIDAITGATGAQGATGARGVTGKDGVAAGFDTPATVVNVLSENATPTVGVSASGTDTNKKFTFTFGFPKGLRGITGAQGNTGPTGAQGADGPRGATGARGSQGPQGAKGLQGVTGLQGDKGPTGTKGADGPRGATGARGSQGPQGAKGLQGVTGLQGDKGPTGTKGADGPRGATGARGSQGPQGARGVQGATGGAGFIASVDRQNFTKANWETYGAVGHQENWSNTTIPAGMIAGDLFVITGCATDTGDGYQLVYKYDPAFRPGSTTLRGTCISSHIIARKGATGTIGVTVSGSGNAVTGATLSGGTLTLTKGNSFLPLSGGTVSGILNVSSINVVNGISDGQLKWNKSTYNGASPIDMSMSSYMSANRLAFARPAGITIEYSNNNGSSWTSYGAPDEEKRQLVTYKDRVVFKLGKKTSTTTTADQLRITLNAVSMGVYTDMKKIFIYFSTAGANCRLSIQYQLFTDSNTTWHTHLSNMYIGGDAGWNCYALDKPFGGFNASETRAFIKNLRLIFTTTSASPGVSPGVYGLALYGPNVWVAPSNQARFDTLYSSDYAQHMMLPNGAYPDTTLVGELGNSSHVWSSAHIKTLNVTSDLKIGGAIANTTIGTNHALIQDSHAGVTIMSVDNQNGKTVFGETDGIGSMVHNWATNFEFDIPINATRVNASEGFFQTSDIRKKNIKEELDLEKCYEMLDKCQEVLYTLKGDNKEQIGMIAQEVEEFFPEIISTDKDGFKSIDYAKLSVICLRIVKDLYKRVLLLENK